MKKLIYIFISLLLFTSCNSRTSNPPQNSVRQHIFHTYYGDIDINTMEVAFTRNGHNWYQVRYSEKDSFYFYDTWKYIYGPIKDYYCPDSNCYEETFPDNHGQEVIVEIDPYHQYDWLKR